MPDVTNYGSLRMKDLQVMNIVGSKITTDDQSNPVSVGSYADLILHSYDDSGGNELKATLHFTGTKTFTLTPNAVVTNLLGPDDDDDASTQPYLEYLLGPGQFFHAPTSLTAWSNPPNNTFAGSVNTFNIYSTNNTFRNGFCLINIPISDRIVQYAEFELIKLGDKSSSVLADDTLNFGVGIINKESYLGLSSADNNWVTELLLTPNANKNVGITPQFQNGSGNGNSVQVYNGVGGATTTGPHNLTSYNVGSFNSITDWLGQGLKVQIAVDLNRGVSGGALEVCWISNNSVKARQHMSGLQFLESDVSRYYFIAYIVNIATTSSVELRVSPNTSKIGYCLSASVTPASEIGPNTL